MKMKPENVTIRFTAMIDECKTIIEIGRNDNFLDFVENKSERRSIRQFAGQLGATMRALLELNTVYNDMVTTYRMARRYPWRGTQITRSQHLQFTWVQFVNQCYLFHEKYKLAVNQLNECNKIFGQTHVAVQPGLKAINKEFGKLIRARGQHFHEWFAQVEHIDHYAMIEFLESFEHNKGKFGDSKKLYSVAKKTLASEIEGCALFIEKFFKNAMPDHISNFVRILKMFNRLVLEYEKNTPAEKRQYKLS